MNAQRLSGALALCRSVIRGKSCLPILNHVHVVANGKLQLTATDLDTAIRITFDEQISEQPFETCVPMCHPVDSRFLWAEVLRGLDDVILSHVPAETGKKSIPEKFSLSSGRFKAAINSMPASDFPGWNEDIEYTHGEFMGAKVELFQREDADPADKKRFDAVIKRVSKDMKKKNFGFGSKGKAPKPKAPEKPAPKPESKPPAVVVPVISVQEQGERWGVKLSGKMRKAWAKNNRPRHINPVAERLARVASRNVGRGQVFYLAAAYRFSKAR